MIKNLYVFHNAIKFVSTYEHMRNVFKDSIVREENKILGAVIFETDEERFEFYLGIGLDGSHILGKKVDYLYIDKTIQDETPELAHTVLLPMVDGYEDKEERVFWI